MPSDILAVFSKVWTDGFKVTYGHDSSNCKHCLRGKLHLTPKVKYSSTKKTIEDQDSANDDEVPVSFFKTTKQAPVVKHESIPKNFYSHLGINLTQAVITKLKLKNNYTIPQIILTPIEKLSSGKQIFQKKTYRCPKNGRLTYDCNEKNKIVTKRKSRQMLRKQLLNKNNKSTSQELPLKNSAPLKSSKAKVLVKKKKSTKLRNPIEKSSKQPSIKEPVKGTLKRRRWNLQKLKKCNADYEDDLFEDQVFCDFKTTDGENSNSEKYDGMLTPKISLSPTIDVSSSPSYKDCYSPTELLCNRKEAEEYIYRREKRRKLKLQDEKNGITSSPESCRKNQTDTTFLLEQTSAILKKLVFKAEKNNQDSDKDDYFSDSSDSVI